LFDVPINVNNQVQTIHVKLGDAVVDLADAFCDNHALPRENSEAIANVILQRLQEFQSQAQAEEEKANAEAAAQAQAQAQAEAQAQAQAQAQAEADAQAQALSLSLGQARAEAAAQAQAQAEANAQAEAAAAKQLKFMFNVPVNAGARGQANIPIHEGDKPNDVATAFLQRNNLPMEMHQALVQGIFSRFAEYSNAQQARESAQEPAQEPAATALVAEGEERVLNWLRSLDLGGIAKMYRGE
jgi:hypothetical protein